MEAVAARQTRTTQTTSGQRRGDIVFMNWSWADEWNIAVLLRWKVITTLGRKEVWRTGRTARPQTEKSVEDTQQS